MAARGKAFRRPSTQILPEHSYEEIMAVRDLADGTASPAQQRVAINWIIRKAGMVGGLSYNPEQPNEIFINEGRRFVGVSLVEMIAEPMESIRRRFPGPISGREPKETGEN